MNVMSMFSSVFGGVQGYLIAVGVSLVLGLAGGGYAGFRFEKSVVDELKLSDAKAMTAAVVRASFVKSAEDRVALDAAVAHATFEVHLDAQFETITKEIPIYVHDKISCPGPTVGLARVMRAAAAGTDPATLQLATGQSDDDCSDVAATEVAGWVAAYAKASIANAGQLNDLEAEIRADHRAQVAP